MSDPTTARDEVVLERHFDAPIELLWQMWTDPDQFSTWYGPAGAHITVQQWDLREGGARLVRMTAETPRGVMDMWFAGQFLTIVENHTLAYTEYIADEHAHLLASHDAHAATEVRVDFSRTGDATKIIVRHIGIPADSPGAAGWTMALDKLGAQMRTQDHA
jgi:uncharacterized protein YndB with AHSA1/START domain